MNLILSLLLSLNALAAQPFTVHEWGTFTSFQNSAGLNIYGLQRGDEPLPNFVYVRNPNYPEPSHEITGCHNGGYSCDWRPNVEPAQGDRLAVNQRMETPVVYFYSDVPRSVEVSVDFPQGFITEWYPSATSFRPAIGNVREIANGRMVWNVDVHTDRLALPPVSPDSIWAPSRQVESNDISVGGENERLIFYRGVGDFSTPFRTSSGARGFTLTNTDRFANVPEVIYIRVGAEGGFVRSLGALGAGVSSDIPYGETALGEMLPMPQYLEAASQTLVAALQRSGLYADEARAMANTWRRAYFETPGERFLYVLPRAWTDRLLPLRVTPTPDALERVLVGRVEVMNQAARENYYTRLHAAAQAVPQVPLFTGSLGPFAEQVLELMLERVRQDSKESQSVTRNYIEAGLRELRR